MPNVLVRDIDEKLLKELKKAAKAEGRSLQAVLHEALEQAALLQRARLRNASDKWLKLLADRPQSDSTELIREDRDSR
jgi:plasmid stability protein